jgi:hypothetical protein
MALPAEYLVLLERLAEAFGAYEAATGSLPVLVGGAAAAIQTGGEFMSADFDIVAADDAAFERAMEAAGFVAEDRKGRLLRGFYHPDFPAYGVEQVSGPLFDGRSDKERLIQLEVLEGNSIVLPAIEDLIADRLAQHSVASRGDDSRLRQARTLLRMAKEIDRQYLFRRIDEEGGDASLLEI